MMMMMMMFDLERGNFINDDSHQKLYALLDGE